MPGFKSAHVQGVELENLGQQEVLGKLNPPILTQCTGVFMISKTSQI